MSSRITIVRAPDGTIALEIEAPPQECTRAARRLRAIAALTGARLKGMEIPEDPSVPPPPVPMTGKVNVGGGS